MTPAKRIDQLVNIARLYYEHNYTQQMIAEKTGLSRPYISKLLDEARESGIVEIRINDPNGTESKLERDLKQRFGLKKAIATPLAGSPEESIMGKLSVALSRYLNLIVSDGDIIGVSWGTTLYTCSMKLKVIEQVSNIQVVQMCGAVSMADRDIYASEIPKKFAEAFSGTPYLLPLPAVVDNIEAKNAIVKDKSISSILRMAQKANVAICSVGVFGHDRTLCRAGYVSHRQVDELLAKGAVGDMCSRIITADGRVCDPELNGRTIGIELDDLKTKEHSILVSGGLEKTECIKAALTGGYANVLITDENVGHELLA